MNEESRLAACISLLEEGARRQPSVDIYHNLARLRLDQGDGPAAAHACVRAVSLGRDGVNVAPIIAGTTANPYPAAVRANRARLLMEGGFASSAVIAELTRASVALRDGAAVRSLLDYERFFRCHVCEPALRLPLRRIADVFLESPAWYGDPADRAIRHASRYDAISASSQVPEIVALYDVLRQAAGDYIASLDSGPDAHPFTASAPSTFHIEAWGVISGEGGYHQPHIHPSAWATGVLYISAPPSSSRSADRIGWLRVGPPGDLVPAAPEDWLEREWEERWIQPAPGLLVVFPAYFTHETFPMGCNEERICVAFDIVPRPM
jgi:Putative 2OG-Fe(II) oxygenase